MAALRLQSLTGGDHPLPLDSAQLAEWADKILDTVAISGAAAVLQGAFGARTRPLPNAALQEWQAASATQQLQGESLVRGYSTSNVPARVRAEIKQTLTAMALPDTAANNLDAAIAFMRTQVQTSYSKAQREERESVIDTQGESSVSIVTKMWALRHKLTAVHASMQALLPDQHWLQFLLFCLTAVDPFVNDMHGLTEANLKARAATVAHARDNAGRETYANCNDARGCQQRQRQQQR